MADSDSNSGCSTDFEASASGSTGSSLAASSANVQEEGDYEDDYEVDEFESESHELNDSIDQDGAGQDGQNTSYEEESFDEYSESFDGESGGQALRTSTSSSCSRSQAPIMSTLSSQTHVWRTGERVQVFWGEENEWFNGVLHDTKHSGKELSCRVLYDDGEDEWEEEANCRPFPDVGGDLRDVEQLQQLGPHSASSLVAIVGRKALAYWPSESKWYGGVITAVQIASAVALQVQYDDGECRWEQEPDFRHILLLHARPVLETPSPPIRAHRSNPTLAPPSPPLSAPVVQQLVSPPAPDTAQPPPPPTGPRVLYARPYQRVYTRHVQPFLTARPYHCAVATHVGSIITARRVWGDPNSSSDAHVVSLSVLPPEKCDAGVQTTSSSPGPA